jgi:hypothetical protein
MLGFSVQAPGEPVDAGVGRNRSVTKSRQKANEALGATAEHRLHSVSGRKVQQVSRDLSEGHKVRRLALSALYPLEPTGEGFRLIQFDHGEGCEVNLSGQVRAAKAGGQEAGVRTIKYDRGRESPPVVGSKVAGTVRVRLLQ